jgi:hypothetical protein
MIRLRCVWTTSLFLGSVNVAGNELRALKHRGRELPLDQLFAFFGQRRSLGEARDALLSSMFNRIDALAHAELRSAIQIAEHIAKGDAGDRRLLDSV